MGPLAYIGQISYGIYLYHVIIIGTGAGTGVFDEFPWSVIISLAIAVASYELYERPILRLKDRFH
ncbi:MAG: hypothetical protein QM724_09755 [Flavobacteriales bacterium]